MRCSPPIWVTNVTSLLLKIMSVHAVSTSKVSPYICIAGLICIVMAVLAVTYFTSCKAHDMPHARSTNLASRV